MNRSHFLKRLIGIAGYGAFNLHTIISKRKIYLQQFFVAGFRHYKGMELLGEMQTNDLIELRREPDNTHDECAIALYWQQEKIGYVPADANELLSRLIDAEALPLLGTITHLNKQVKPWESVAIAIYFLQDSAFELPQHAQHLQQIEQPTYRSKHTKSSKKPAKDLYQLVFEEYKGIVDLDNISDPEIKQHFEKYYSKPKQNIVYQGNQYTNITTNDIYTYLYQVNPLKAIIASDGNEYVIFNFDNQMV